MTLVKKKNSALIKRVDDSRVPAFLAEGFEVLNVGAQEEPEKKAAVSKPVGKMTVEELKAYAAEKGIALPEDGKKPDLLVAIEAVEGEVK